MSHPPWRLPPPPGMDAGATSVPSSDASSSVFSFRRRSSSLPWRDLLQIDLGRIIQTVDLQLLHRYLETVTFADIGPADVEYFTDGNFVHLFRLCQLLLEYSLFAWSATKAEANHRAARYASLKTQALKLRDALAKLAAENKSLKKEVACCNRVISVLEERQRAGAMQPPMHPGHHYPPLGNGVGGYVQPYAAPHAPPSSFQPKREEEKQSAESLLESQRTASLAQAQIQAQYAAQMEQLQRRMEEQLRASVQAESERRNLKLEQLEASLQLLLQAQQDEMRKQAKEQQQAQQSDETSSTAAAPHPITPSPSQAAQQRLINSILQDVSNLRAENGAAPLAGVSIEACKPPAQSMTLDLATTVPHVTPAATAAVAPSSSNAAATAASAGAAPAAPSPAIPVPNPATSLSQSVVRPTSSRIYNFGLPTPAAASSTTGALLSSSSSSPPTINVLASPLHASSFNAGSMSTSRHPFVPPRAPAALGASIPSAGAQGLNPAPRPLPAHTPQQKAELETLDRWLASVEAEEVGAELLKMQLESAIVAREQEAARLRALAEADEAEVRRIEAAMPPDHPLLAGTVLQSPARAAAEPKVVPQPSGTIELQAPASIAVPAESGALTVGERIVLLPPPFQKQLPTTRDPVLPPAPLADPTPLPSREEKLESLLHLSPASRLRALEEEKVAIRLRAVLSARSSAALYAPFPSLPFLPSLYNHSAEELREHHDLVWLWSATAMRSEEGAQELLRYAVQMDCTGEIYEEVKERLDACMQFYTPPAEQLQAERALRELERANELHAYEESDRALREARWHEDRISSFERVWAALQQHEEDREYYQELAEQAKLEAREQEFQAYLAKLEAKSAARKAEQMAAQAEPELELTFPPASDFRSFAISRAQSPRSAKPSPTRQTSALFNPARSPSLQRSASTSSTASSGIVAGPSLQLGSRNRASLPPVTSSPARRTAPSRRTRLALRTDEDDDEEEETQEEEAEGEGTEGEGTEEEARVDQRAQTAAQSSAKAVAVTTPPSSRPTSSKAQRTSSTSPAPQQRQEQSEAEDDEFAAVNSLAAASGAPAAAPALPRTPAKTPSSPARLSRVRMSSPHAPPSNPAAAAAAAANNVTPLPSARSAASQRQDDDDDDDVEEEDDDAEARRRVQRMASGPSSAASASLLSRPAATARSKRATPVTLSSSSTLAAPSNQTPDRALSLAQQQLGTTGPTAPDAPRPRTRNAGEVEPAATGSLFQGFGAARPKTSVGSRPNAARFLGTNDSFDEDEDDDAAASAAAHRQSPPRTPDLAPNPSFGAGGDTSRVLNPRRSAALNFGAALSSAGGVADASSRPLTAVTSGGSNPTPVPAPSRPLGRLVAGVDSLSDSDGNVSDVSSVMQLDESRGPAANAVNPTPAPAPAAAAVAASNPLFPSSGPIIQSGRGRPRAAGIASSLSNPSLRPTHEEDSLSSLLGGGIGMRRPMGRGLSSRARLAAMQDTDNESDNNTQIGRRH